MYGILQGPGHGGMKSGTGSCTMKEISDVSSIGDVDQSFMSSTGSPMNTMRYCLFYVVAHQSENLYEASQV